MVRSACWPVAVVAFVLAATAARGQEDLRAKYATDNPAAARAVDAGIRAAEANRTKEAIAAFREALKLDPKCGMAHFQLALTLGDVGDIEESIAAFKVVFAAETRVGRNVRAVAATNLGLTYAKLDQLDDAVKWFSRAVLEDYDNAFQERAKSYRNMAISLRSQKKPLAAAVAIAMAYEDKAKNCPIDMVREFFKDIDSAETARILALDPPLPAGPWRKDVPKLEAVETEIAAKEAVVDLLADPVGKRVLALVADGYYPIAAAGPSAATKVECERYKAACLIAGELYFSRTGPDRIDRVDIPTGKVLDSTKLDVPAPASLAVAPARRRAFFPVDGIVHQFDFATGKSKATNSPGQAVAADPTQRFVYSYVKPDPADRARSGFVVVDGRVFQVTRPFDWLQTTLFKSAITPGGLLLAEIRDNAASNGQRFVVGLDGATVGIVGGGGYRPTAKEDGGYGVKLFDAGNFETDRGFYACDAYPLGGCVNPVTGTVVSLRRDSLRTYAAGSKAESATLKGPWSGPATWSGDGKLLVVAKATTGISIFRMALAPAEEKVAAGWTEKLKPTPLVGGDAVANAVGPITSLTRFAIPEKVTAEAVKVALSRAIEKGRSGRPIHWANHPPYVVDATVVPTVGEAIAALRGGARDQQGIALFKLRKLNEKRPGLPPVQFFLAELQARKEMPEAEAGFVQAIRGDAGQTDISLLALEGLSLQHAAAGRDLAVAYCWAAALECDTANPRTIQKLTEALTKAKLPAEAEKVRGLASATGTSAAPGSVRDLPALPPPGNPRKLSGEDLYARAAPSVVLLKTGEGSGSGVCVGRGNLVLTNAHVVDRADEVTVIAFEIKDKNLVRRGEARGKVIYRSETADLALVELAADGPKLVPLPVAAATPKAGAKVYAIGSPGLGNDVLELSISEGVVSAPARKIDGRPYLQHTSAVNPGNSGGPLLDESGRVIGIATLKAKLENVGFAVPVEVVRELFPKK